MGTTSTLGTLVSLAPLLLAILAWAKLGPDRSKVAVDTLSTAVDQLRGHNEDLYRQLVGCRQKRGMLERQLRENGIVPITQEGSSG